MNCDCITKINAKLREKNFRLCGYAFTFPRLDPIITIATEWVDSDKAPKGKKRRCPAMLASYCPFCGTPIEQEKEGPCESS